MGCSSTRNQPRDTRLRPRPAAPSHQNGTILGAGRERAIVATKINVVRTKIQSPHVWLYAAADGEEHRTVGVIQHGLTVRLVERRLVEGMIVANHYSGTRVANARLFLGIFSEETFLGAMIYGPVKNPGTQGSIVEGTETDEYLELNRLWISDELPRNTESKVLAMSFRLIRRVMPRVKWIQSFADGRVGVGTIYQATNFLYCGRHKTTFWELDGEWYHEQHMTVRSDAHVRPGTRAWKLQAGRNRATAHTFWQYRYVLPIQDRKGVLKRLLKRVQPYPKLDENDSPEPIIRGMKTCRVPIERPRTKNARSRSKPGADEKREKSRRKR